MTDRWENLDASKLARLLDVDSRDGSPAKTNWQDDPAAILNAQLAAPLLPDLLIVPGTEEPRLRRLVPDPRTTFADQLLSPTPHLELLEAIKNFARHVKSDAASPLRGTPADILYFAAIASGLVHRNARITSLTDAQLREGFTWTERQVGAESLTALFGKAAASLS